MSIEEEKKQQRQYCLNRRQKISKEYAVQASKDLSHHFFQNIEIRNHEILSAYWAIKDEISPYIIMKDFLKNDKKCALPVIIKKARPLMFRSWYENMPMETMNWGIEVPKEENSDEVTPDIVIVPLLGFNLKGDRLGYGGGYYDRTLMQLEKELQKRNRHLLKIGVGFDIQRLDDLIVEQHDVQLDWIITENYAHKCA